MRWIRFLMTVQPITKSEADEFVTRKHYSRRASIFWAGFGLVENGDSITIEVVARSSISTIRSPTRGCAARQCAFSSS